MGVSRVGTSRWAIGTVVAVLLAASASACEDGAVEPPEFTTITDTAALDTTRDDLATLFGRMAETAIGASGGGALRGGSEPRAVSCGDPYPDRFRQLETGGSFVVQDATVDGVAADVLAAWQAEGWDASVTEGDRVALETTVGDDVRVVGSVRLRETAAGSGVVAVSVRAGTPCLELPESAGA